MTKAVWIHGYTGRMGRELQALIESAPSRWKLIGGTALDLLIDSRHQREMQDWSQFPTYLDAIDLIVDFSAAPANQKLLTLLQQSSCRGKALLIGTTGLSDAEKAIWRQFAHERQLRLLLAPNTSLGILLTLKISQLTAQVLSPLGFDVEILETHHRAKLDAPSGTAKFLADGLAATLQMETKYGREGVRKAQEIGVASLRGGSVFGEHEVRLLGDNEEIVISHRALNRTLFAQGALLLASWICEQKAGDYRLEDISIEAMVDLLRRR